MNIYFAASLFNAREVEFNSKIVRQIESETYQFKLPQRDGFEFANLKSVLEDFMDGDDILEATNHIIYHLDIGQFLFNSDAVVAVLDEPADEGVMVEISYAKVMSIPVIGIRTDVRSPYGEFNSKNRGVHFFPYYQCDYWIPALAAMPDSIQSKITHCLENIKNSNNRKTIVPHMAEINKKSNILFKGLATYNNTDSIKKVVQRYIKNRSLFVDPITY